jgi:hypothetical protein
MNNTNVLEKINRRARQIVKNNPSIPYRDAQKQAGLERREKVSGRDRRGYGTNKKKRPAASVGAKYRVRHVVEKIGATQINETRRKLEDELKAQRAWMLLAKDSATSKKARDKAARELAANKRDLKAIGSRKATGNKKRRK